MLTRPTADFDGVILSQVVPLTIQALEIVLADLKNGNSQNDYVTLPPGGIYKPFITITHETAAKIMKLELSKTK